MLFGLNLQQGASLFAYTVLYHDSDFTAVAYDYGCLLITAGVTAAFSLVIVLEKVQDSATWFPFS